ncbi:hypothetical protein [Acetobacter orientalis]|uniref:Uncharacterized protein n=1 Tax=Acetobacter orientalis TaxID=146474 RepID=A0A0D6NN86_9PROT|nr:hypothetical protein [Acetobacter orientalis]GAN66866.1 hypothetical protein Abor_031_032 [Acetobacter orientalis]GBR14416.1 hypothetical protein AA0481_0607 [Acetobacter orientalis NRIC 0481]GEL60889.1 hypothetical protein AOR02nite_07310 [Acetobacter orientalis]
MSEELRPTRNGREYGEAAALEIQKALKLSSHDLPALARYARSCFDDGAAWNTRAGEKA